MKDIRFITGFILVLLASIACGFSPLLWIFAIPVFVIGVILILVSGKSVKTKLLAAFAPFAFIVAGASIFWHFYSKTTPETYLIPADFQGNFRVVYGEPCGLQPAEEDGRRVMPIPPNGVLIVAPEAEYGTIDHQYYFVDANGKRTPAANVSLDATGSTSNGAAHDIAFSHFFVGDFSVTSGLAAPDMDSVMTAAVEACREK